MKNLKIYRSLILLIGVAIISSCSKEFLDKNPYDSVPLDQEILDETDLGLAINGMYASMRGNELYGRTLPMMGDVMADNVYISPINTGRYLAFNNYVILSNNGEADEIWETTYTTILRANQCISANIPVTSGVEQLKGEAYAVRALMYFELIRCFARPFNGSNQNDAGVPLILVYDPTNQPARNTIGEVYSQIITDLNLSISLMTIDKNSEYMSPWPAKALLAKVYQYMGDWNNALPLALSVVNSSGYKLADSANYLKYWANPAATSKSETLFEISIDGTNNNGVDALQAMFVQQAYGDALCDTALSNIFLPSDVRSKQVAPGSHHGIPCILVKKYPNYLNSSDKDDAKVLRLSEIYLLLAEAYYNTADETNALQYLNTLAKKRDTTFAGYSSTGMALLDDITLERRKELAFEGNRFFDLNRLGKVVQRSPLFPLTALSIPFSDHRRILPIPLYEMDANPNMTQNPGY